MLVVLLSKFSVLFETEKSNCYIK